MDEQIRILLIDDHSLFRESLGRLLEAEPGFQIAAACGSVAEAIDAMARQNIDVVLLDYDLGEEQGSIFLDYARDNALPARVLMVTAGMSDSDTLHALENGCAGVFLKHSPPAQLVDAIHKVADGETWLDSKAIKSLVAGATAKPHAHDSANELTARERSVLKALFEGLANKEIAVQLDVTENAVKWAIQQLFQKTGVRTRSQLVRIALERGWVETEVEPGHAR